MLLEELEEVEAAEVGKFHMNPMVLTLLGL
jgi:hypothetical protein